MKNKRMKECPYCGEFYKTHYGRLPIHNREIIVKGKTIMVGCPGQHITKSDLAKHELDGDNVVQK